MKKALTVLGIAIFAIPTFAMAAYFMENNSIPQGEVVMGNLYLSGDSPTMAGDVKGDLYAAGGNVAVTGNVSNDVVIAGGTVTLTGEIGDDVRIFGGTLFIDGKVNGEVIAFGGDVKLGPNANVRKDVVAGGGMVTIDDSAKIFGSTKIYSDNGAGEKAKTVMEKVPKEALQTAIFAVILMTILTYLVVAAVMMGLFPKVVGGYLKHAAKKENFWKSFGLGLLVLIVTPIIAVLCMVTGIGVMLGFIILSVYLMYILLNVALAGVLFGSLMQKWIMKLKKVEMNWLWGLGGVAVLHIITLVPIIGWLVGLVFFLYSMGAIITVDYKMLKGAK